MHQTMDAFYDKIKEDDGLRKEWAEKCGFGFELPSDVPIVPRTQSDELEQVAR
jgi:hypothetical protein